MPYRTANYSAFYVTEPFSTSNLGAYATPDFIYYNQLRAWKEKDASFPFVDALALSLASHLGIPLAIHFFGVCFCHDIRMKKNQECER